MKEDVTISYEPSTETKNERMNPYFSLQKGEIFNPEANLERRLGSFSIHDPLPPVPQQNSSVYQNPRTIGQISPLPPKSRITLGSQSLNNIYESCENNQLMNINWKFKRV